MVIRQFIFLLFMIIVTQNDIWAQKIIHGTVKNKKTGQVLLNTNIHVVGTYRGTISNEEGKYILTLDNLPATILFSYIGYKSQEIFIVHDSPEEQNINLQPVAIPMETIVFTGEDPAIVIMKEVIKQKEKWRHRLETYIAEGYTRLVLENDTSIVSISESTSKVFWDNKKGSRELINAKRSTSNLSFEQNFAAASYLPNFYDDDIQLQGAKFIGPTHPDALKYYEFHLENEKVFNNKTVFNISVTPRTKLNPAFVGHIQVLDKEYAMIDVDLKPSEAFIMPAPVKDWNLSYKQQFNNFGKEFWLPADVRIKGDMKIGIVGFEMPRIKYMQISRITDYKINCALPDSLYKNQTSMIMNASNIQQDTLLASTQHVIPLTENEKEAYTNLDSTMTLDKAFKPRGFLADLATIAIVSGNDTTEIKGSNVSNNVLQKLSPLFRFNRVDGFHLGLKYNQQIFKNFKMNLFTAYKTGLKDWAYGTELSYHISKNFNMNLSYTEDTFVQNKSEHYPLWVNSLNTLAGYDDYFDYFWNQSWKASIQYMFNKYETRIRTGIKNEQHRSVNKKTDYNLLGRDVVQNGNPVIIEGVLRAVDLNIKIGESNIPWGIIGQNQASITIEHSSQDLFDSDFSFTSCYLTAETYSKTFYRRRVLPNALYCKLQAFASIGDIPVQCIRVPDMRIAGFTPFGVFKTLGSETLKSGNFISIFWEHNFGTVPFEIIGLKGVARTGIGIIIHGSSGKFWRGESQFLTDVSNPNFLNNIQHEIGISINKIFNFFRIDFTKNLNRDDYFIGVSIARMF